MLKVECESCKAPYQIDERRVPSGGMKMRCPKCGHSFLVMNPNAADLPSMRASSPPHVPPPPDFDELPAVKGKAPPAPSAAPAGPHRPPSFSGALDGLDLPALASDAGLPATAKKKAAPRPTGPAVAAAPPAPPAPAPPAANPFDSFGSVDDDLPAVPGFGEIDFPMAKQAPAAPFPAPPKPHFGDAREATGVGLPAAVARPAAAVARPAAPGMAPPPKAANPAPGGFGDIGDIGLPALSHSSPPAAHGAPRPGGPAKVPSFGNLDMGFGDIGLPAVSGGAGLPSAASGGVGLPAVSGGAGLPSPAGGGGVGLPALGGGGAGLPSPAGGGGVGLPALGGGGAGLPALGGGGAGLPALGGGAGLPALGGAGLPARPDGDFGFGELDLPSLMSDLPGMGGAGLPSAGANAFNANLPSPTAQGHYLPSMSQGQGLLPGQSNLPAPAQGNYLPSMADGQGLLPSQSNLPSPVGGFGDIDLPTAQSNLGSNFGEVDIGGGGQYGSPAAAGGLSFGEVDLGGGTDLSSDALMSGGGGAQPAISGGFAGSEASLDANRQSRPRPASRQGGSSRAPRIVAGLLALIVLGGVALQATPYGAFGYLAISDALHAGEWKKATANAATQSRNSLGIDVYGDARKTSSDLVTIQAKYPRARPLAAYAAFTEYAVELRFGVVTEHAAKASYLLGQIPPKTDVQYLTAAQGAREAVAGNYAAARTLLDAASKKDPNDPVQDDIRFVRGELELSAKEPDAAIAAFAAAGQGTSPRAHFGLARAYLLKKDRKKAQQEVDATLKGAPEHVGALLTRAKLVWSLHNDDVAALKDLKEVIDGAAKPNASPGELSLAYSTRGWVHLSVNRASEARAAFDEARKLDSRNASALIGQGELLYADGRHTEAISRFDEAVQKSPDDIDAICGAAKTKIALERLQDAKNQLTTARSTFKSEMPIALWLGKAEEALGNKSVAETEYNVAIELSDPQLPNAVEPYAALAKLLASQGRTAEALQKLELARNKLADTPALQRAFGEVLVAQGKFDEALGYYLKALAKNDNDVATHFKLGQAYRKMRKHELSGAELDKVSALDKDYPGLALERGMLFEESGDLSKALEQFQGALAKAPTDLDLMLRVGAAYVVIGQTGEGVKMLTKVFEQRPNSAEANHFLGRAYLRQGGLQATAAMPRLRRAAELDPNRAEYHLYVAWAANEMVPPDMGLARKEVDKALELDSTLADGYWQRGVVNFKQSAVKDAERDLRKALELKPNRIEAHASLAEVLEAANNDNAALVEWNIACTANPKNAFWRYRLGRLQLEHGRAADAAGNLTFAVQEATAMQPRPGWLWLAAYPTAEAQRKIGKKAEAIETYKLFLQMAPASSPDRADAIRALKQLGGLPPE